MKKKVLYAALMGAVLTGSAVAACSKKETDADKGKKAAQEFCSCLGSNPTTAKMEECETALGNKYGKESTWSEEFGKAAEAEAKNCAALQS